MRKGTSAAIALAVFAVAALAWAGSTAEAQVRPPARQGTHATRRAADKPFSFRGIALGITLDQFRNTALVRAAPAGSLPLCDTDMAAAGLGMDLRSDDSVTVSCRWAHRTESGWQPSRAVVAGTLARDHVLRFTRTPDQRQYRLYEISFVVDEGAAREVRDALADRYGPPRLANMAGAPVSAAPIYVWRNAASSITLIYLPASRAATLTYLLDDPDAWLRSVARRWLADSPGAG